MAKKEKIDGVEDETLDSMKAQLDDVCAKVRRMSDNWKRFVLTGAVGPASLEKGSDGKLGLVNIRMLFVIMCSIVACACFVAIAGVTIDPSQTDSYISDGSRFRVNTNGDVYTKGAIYSDGAVISASGAYTNGANISNANAIVYASNITATTTITLPTAGIASAALPTTMSDLLIASNANLKVYGSNLVVTTSLTLPAAGIASAALPASMVSSTLFSNNTAKVYASNMVLRAGGTFVVGAGSTITVPAGSVTPLALTGGITRTLTNIMAGTTNFAYYYGGILTNTAVTAGSTAPW